MRAAKKAGLLSSSPSSESPPAPVVVGVGIGGGPGKSLAQNTSSAIFVQMQNTSRAVFALPFIFT